MDFTETFHLEDTITLTAEEKEEADQLQKDECLRRTNPAAYVSLLAKRSTIAGLTAPRAPNPFEYGDNYRVNEADRSVRPWPIDTSYGSSGVVNTLSPRTSATSIVSLLPNANVSRGSNPEGLTPIPASSTQVQSNVPTPSEKQIRSAEVKSLSEQAVSSSSSPSRTIKAHPRFQKLLESEAARMARENPS